MKALFGLWLEIKPADINRILKPHGVRLVVKKSKEWGKQVTVTAHPIAGPARRARAAKPVDEPCAPAGSATLLGLDQDAARMEAGFGAALDLTRKAVSG